LGGDEKGEVGKNALREKSAKRKRGGPRSSW